MRNNDACFCIQTQNSHIQEKFFSFVTHTLFTMFSILVLNALKVFISRPNAFLYKRQFNLSIPLFYLECRHIFITKKWFSNL